MSSDVILPKRVVAYIHQMGVRALDRLAGPADHAPRQHAQEGEPTAAHSPSDGDALENLVQHWHRMTIEQKRNFVDQVTASVVAVVSASAALPLTLKMEKIAARATKKVIKREKKKLKKAARAESKKKDEAAKAKKKKARAAKDTKKASPAPKPKAKTRKKAPKKARSRSAKKGGAASKTKSPARNESQESAQ